jgi:hypothetical protein
MYVCMCVYMWISEMHDTPNVTPVEGMLVCVYIRMCVYVCVCVCVCMCVCVCSGRRGSVRCTTHLVSLR